VAGTTSTACGSGGKGCTACGSGTCSAGECIAEGNDGGPHDASTSDAQCGVVYFQDSFADNSKGWILDPTWSIAPTCASPPTPQKGNPDPTSDHTGTSGSGVLGAYVCGNNPAGQTSVARYATSRAVDVSGAPSVTLSFWRWLNSDSAPYMTSTVDVYNGASWINLYTNPSGATNQVTDSAWNQSTIDVTSYKNAAFQVRFGFAVPNIHTYSMSDWNVDDVVIASAPCP
jgi:hypothetical protein